MHHCALGKTVHSYFILGGNNKQSMKKMICIAVVRQKQSVWLINELADAHQPTILQPKILFSVCMCVLKNSRMKWYLKRFGLFSLNVCKYGIFRHISRSSDKKRYKI